MYLKKKKSETEWTAGVLKKKIKANTQSYRTVFNQTKQDRMQIFKGNLFFEATNNAKTNK